MGLWRVLSDLEEDGYRTEWGLFSAEETGAPHQRIRVFILGYAKGARLPRGIMGPRKEQSRGTGSRDAELAHTASREPRQSQARNGGQDIGGGSEEELADSECCGSAESMQLDTDLSTKPSGCDREEGQELGQTRWPARPGEEQYEWEEPRVTEAQSELGGAVDGLTHRVDRLRLLGNGVVPQTAELAWKTLWRKMDEQL